MQNLGKATKLPTVFFVIGSRILIGISGETTCESSNTVQYFRHF